MKGIIRNFTTSRQGIYKEGYLLPVMDADTLLRAGRHQAVLRQLKDTCGLPEAYFEAFYKEAIDCFVEFVQVLPTDFDSPLCGLMNQGLSCAMIALQTYQIEHAKTIDPLKSYAVFTAALFKDISRVVINQRVLFTEDDGNAIDYWNPLEGSMLDKAEYYRLIRLGEVYQRLDYTLRHLLARQLMPERGYQWIASDLHLLADWFDAINGDGSQGGVLAHMLGLMKREDVVALQSSLVQVPVKQKESPATEHGFSFYRWLQDRIDNGLALNTADSGLYITKDGLFIERNTLFKDFLETYNQPVTIAVVYAQFGNLMGITKKGAYDFMNAQYFSESAGGMADTAARTFGSPIRGQQSSLRDGMVLSDPSMVLGNASIPAVTPLLRSMQSKGLVAYDLPSLDPTPGGSTPTPSLDPTKHR